MFRGTFINYAGGEGRERGDELKKLSMFAYERSFIVRFKIYRCTQCWAFENGLGEPDRDREFTDSGSGLGLGKNFPPSRRA